MTARTCACGCNALARPEGIYASDACRARHWKETHDYEHPSRETGGERRGTAESSRDCLARLLRHYGERGITTAEILRAAVGSRYGARLAELRAAGWVVDVKAERAGSYRYALISEPDPALAGVGVGCPDASIPLDPPAIGDGRPESQPETEPLALFEVERHRRGPYDEAA